MIYYITKNKLACTRLYYINKYKYSLISIVCFMCLCTWVQFSSLVKKNKTIKKNTRQVKKCNKRSISFKITRNKICLLSPVLNCYKNS